MVGLLLAYLVVRMYWLSKAVPGQRPLRVSRGFFLNRQTVQEVVSKVQGRSFHLVI